MSSDASCSDCKIELIHKKWSKLLLKWINKCVKENNQKNRVRRLNLQLLSDIMMKYKHDVCEDDIEKVMLSTDDIESFIKYRYPILKLRYLSEEQDLPKKIYIVTSLLLYHCCVHSHLGVVHEDIYKHLTRQEQELVLKFCEKLMDMETTINNVEVAIQDAFEFIQHQNVTSHDGNEVSFNVITHKKSSDTDALMSSMSTVISSFSTLPSDTAVADEKVAIESVRDRNPSVKILPLSFNSPMTVLPSVVTDTSTYSDMLLMESDTNIAEKDNFADSEDMEVYTIESPNDTAKWEPKTDDQKTEKEYNQRYDKKRQIEDFIVSRQQVTEKINDNATQRYPHRENVQRKMADTKKNDFDVTELKSPNCQPECSCTRCYAPGPCCGDPGSTVGACTAATEQKISQPDSSKLARVRFNRKITALVIAVLLFIMLVVALSGIVPLLKTMKRDTQKALLRVQRLIEERSKLRDVWICEKNLCQKVYETTKTKTFTSQSRCTLMCMGPQIWPVPIGQKHFSTKIIALATHKLEYKLKSISSDKLHRYLAEAFKLFIGDLVKLEKSGLEFKTNTIDLDVKKMNIQIEVESDPDPRLRLNTEEAYEIKLETTRNQVVITLSSSSFCGVRHGLETLTQMILLDQSTGYLITVSLAVIKDAPSYKYRGLMIDTGRNYIPVSDLMRTVDAMATVKLNTFHWRISDVTSFPLFLPRIPQLFEFGGYRRSMVYTKEDVVAIVKRAGVRGIRVLMEVAAPGPVGRPWSWSLGANCPSRDNHTCSNVLCMTLDVKDSVMNALQIIYEEILEMTQVDDVFHLSNGLFSLSNCFNLMNNQDGFLDKALDSLKYANKGFLPKLPIIWYTSRLSNNLEAKTWERYGVQLGEWRTNPTEFLAKFKVIHSSKWDLSCEMKKQRCTRYRNWQEMYSWKSWRNLEAFTVEGGEAVLWTDLVHSGNLDYHLWPRTAAVAERLWSDIIANTTADGSVYIRLNSHSYQSSHRSGRRPHERCLLSASTVCPQATQYVPTAHAVRCNDLIAQHPDVDVFTQSSTSLWMFD